MIELIFAPFSYPFMVKALVVALAVACVSAVLSCYLILKGWALMGDAVSHAVFPGLVLAAIFGVPLLIGAFLAGLFSAVATGYLDANSRVREDTVMGVVFSGMFALGIVLFTQFDVDQHIDHILFGNLLGLNTRDIVETLLISAVTLGLVLARRRDLMLYCFDPQHAKAIGLPVGLLHYGLLSVLSLAIVASLKAVGIILVIAMLIGPGATGFMVARRFDAMLLVAVASAVGASVFGLLVSFHVDSATGPTIVLLQAAFFLLALGWSRVRNARPSPRGRRAAHNEYGCRCGP
ncbi:MAG: metal ABC transporter permease [Pseudomonadota bacterium]